MILTFNIKKYFIMTQVFVYFVRLHQNSLVKKKLNNPM